MAGGQSGLSFIGEAGVAFALLGFIGGCTVRGFMDGSQAGDPMDKYDQACAQEYSDANDGNDETEVETAILEQPDCMAYVASMKTERRQDQVEEARP
jgi:hypothetical protein